MEVHVGGDDQLTRLFEEVRESLIMRLHLICVCVIFLLSTQTSCPHPSSVSSLHHPSSLSALLYGQSLPISPRPPPHHFFLPRFLCSPHPLSERQVKQPKEMVFPSICPSVCPCPSVTRAPVFCQRQSQSCVHLHWAGFQTYVHVCSDQQLLLADGRLMESHTAHAQQTMQLTV